MKLSRLRSTTSAAFILAVGVAAPALAVGASSSTAAAQTNGNAASCGATTFASTGDITDTVEEFRTALGDLNAFEPVANLDGRRQINWDAAPAAISDPNEFPGDFFNGDAAPRARGIEFTTPGTGFLLSGDVDDGTPIEFESIRPELKDEFATFSPERLFTPIGSNVVEVKFFSPADQTTPAAVDGFGAVFTDVDFVGNAMIEYFDTDGELLHTVTAAGQSGSETLEFLGAEFDDNCVSSVKITAGNLALAPGRTEGGFVVFEDGRIENVDLVAMDDFIFGEPVVLCQGLTPTIIADGVNPVIGTEGPDVILGSDQRDVIDGRGGDDVICGEGGNDTIRGGLGNDSIDGGANNDEIRGGGGDDLITDPSGQNLLLGQGGNDTIRGGGARDVINGGGGQDDLSGFAGEDNIVGGPGRDRIAGGAGLDSCGFEAGESVKSCELELAVGPATLL